MASRVGFASRLWRDAEQKQSRVVVGLDPVVEKLPRALVERCVAKAGDPRNGGAEAVWQFNKALIEALADIVVAFKPQIAFYEALGPCGLEAYAKTLRCIKMHGAISIGDVKRGDIGSTAEAYAKAHLDSGPFEADAITINPLFGTDGIEPFLRRVRSNAKGLFILVRTSNPGAKETQDLDTTGADGDRGPFYMKLAKLVERWGSDTIVEGYSSVGMVAGATYPEELSSLRREIPGAPILIPGYGAQGATASDVVRGFDARGFGAVVNSSRGIIYASGEEADFASKARTAADSMRRAIQEALAERGG